MHDYSLISVASSLQLTDAEKISEAVLDAAHTAELLPLAVAVLDAGGQLVTFKREDGCGIIRADIAIAKASGALGMGSSSRMLRDRLKDRPAFQATIATASDGKFIAVPGGVLVMDDRHRAIGAVGISGDASDRDEYAAIVGIQAAGFESYPESPSETWRDAQL